MHIGKHNCRWWYVHESLILLANWFICQAWLRIQISMSASEPKKTGLFPSINLCLKDKINAKLCKIQSNLMSFKPQWHLCFRPVVLRPDSDPAPAGEHLWVREGGGERSAELYELPDGSASLHHGHLRSTAAALWHPSYHFGVIHHHRAHHVLCVCAPSQEKTPPQHIRSTRGPTHSRVRCLPALTPLCTCEVNVSLLFLQQSYCNTPLLT